MKKIAFLHNTDQALYHFRLSWMKALIKNGYDVYAIVPEGKFCGKLLENGISVINYSLIRNVGNPFQEIRTIVQLYFIFRKHKFYVLNTATFKPNIYGSLIGKLAGIPVIINVVEGLGRIYNEPGASGKIKRSIVSFLYFIAFRLASKVIFLNNDDWGELKWCLRKEESLLLSGVGTDTECFKKTPSLENEAGSLRKSLNINPDDIVVTTVARLLVSKGILELLKCAEILGKEYDNVVFLIVGWIDKGNLQAIPEEVIQCAGREKNIRFTGERNDVKEILALSDIFALPSFYREGLPIAIVEAMSMSLPIVTTNIPGCKETVEEGANGFLVAPRNPVALASAIEELIRDKELRERMGRASREKAIQKFSVEAIIPKVLILYKELLKNIETGSR